MRRSCSHTELFSELVEGGHTRTRLVLPVVDALLKHIGYLSPPWRIVSELHTKTLELYGELANGCISMVPYRLLGYG